MPDDDMGHHDNITNHTFHHKGERLGKNEKEAKEIVLAALESDTVEQNPELVEMFNKAAVAEGQTVDESKRNALFLLKKVLGK